MSRNFLELDNIDNFPSGVRSVYVNGKRVKTLAEDKIFNLGGHTMRWHSKDDFGRKVSNGIYFIQITSEDIIIKRKIIYMK